MDGDTLMSEQIELFEIKNEYIKEDSKFCIKCKLTKPLGCFSIRGGAIRKDGTSSLRNSCIECNKYSRKVRVYLKSITSKPADDYQCPVCLKTMDRIKEELNDPTNSATHNGTLYWNLDHNHKTGTFRGWLCSRCNSGLGWLGDSVSTLKRGVKYLQDDLDKQQLIDNK